MAIKLGSMANLIAKKDTAAKEEKKDDSRALDDPDLNGDEHEQQVDGIEVASTHDMTKKLRRVKLKRVMIPGVTKGRNSLPRALETFIAKNDDIQSKQDGGTMKVILQVAECYCLADGHEMRYTHRLLASVLAHEVLILGKAPCDPQEAKRKKKAMDKMSEEELQEYQAQEKASRQVHLFRMRECKREVTQTLAEWKAEEARMRDMFLSQQKDPETKKPEDSESEKDAKDPD